MTETAPVFATVHQHPAVLGAVPRTRMVRPWAIAGFLLWVVLPSVVSAWYLWTHAADRYASRAAFSIRSNETTAPVEIFGAITQLGTSSAVTDGQILYDFIRSQPLVAAADAELDLDAIYNRAPSDVVFALGSGATIEDKLKHWNRSVDIAIDPATGILALETRAFSPDDARDIADLVLAESSRLVNALSEAARNDAVRFAEVEVQEAEQRLRVIRTRLRAFRDLEQEVDPTQNAQAALGLVSALEEDLARTQVQLQSLSGVLDPQAPRLLSLARKIDTLKARIAEERTRLGTGAARSGAEARPLAEVVGDYEELVVDREFAEQAYKLALATYEQAQAEARRRHRYLAVHIAPTLSEEADYPDRPVLTGLIAGFALALWAIGSLILANIRERR